MKFFHFTSANGIRGIAQEKRIFLGKIVDKQNQTVAKTAVSLTTVLESSGHGLLDGRVLTQEKIAHLPYDFPAIKQDDGTFCTIDQTEFFLEIDIPKDDSNLIKCQKFYENGITTLELLAITGYLPLGLNCHNFDEVSLVRDNLRLGKLTSRKDTWWYYFKEIDEKMICGVYWIDTQNRHEGYTKIATSLGNFRALDQLM
jgi:hypothetical protein